MFINFIKFKFSNFFINNFLYFIKISIEFVIIWGITYKILKVVRNNNRTVQILKGIVGIIILKIFANFLNFRTLIILLDFFISSGIIILVIIFQPEIRVMLERIGKTAIFTALYSLTKNEKDNLIKEILKACDYLSKKKIGALITLEQGNSLIDFINTGIQLNSLVSSDLLCSIFVVSSPLHDGAVILRGNRIACAAAYFSPSTNENFIKKKITKYGARHRAGLGISEITDSVTIIISEKNGDISIAEKGVIKIIDNIELKKFLYRVIQNVGDKISENFF